MGALGDALLKPHWRVLLGCHIAMMGAVSPIFAAIFGLYLSPMANALGWTRSEVALGLSTFLLFCALATPLIGILVDQYGSRLVTLASAVMLPAAIVIFALAPPWYPGYLFAAALIGLVGSLSLPVTYVGILIPWFDRRLGRAIALAASGLGTGAIISPFVASSLIQRYGWRLGWMYLALWGAALALSGRVLIPWRSHLTLVIEVQSPRFDSSSIRTVLVDRMFWLLTSAFLFAHVVTLGVFANIASAMHDRGSSAKSIALTASIMGVSSLVGRVCGGFLLDWISIRWIGSLTFAIQCLGCILLAFTSTPVIGGLAAALASIAVGMEADLIPFAIRRRYSASHFGRVFGLMYGIIQLGGVVGPVAVAFAFDKLKNYSLAFLGLSALSITASILILLAYRRPYSLDPIPG